VNRLLKRLVRKRRRRGEGGGGGGRRRLGLVAALSALVTVLVRRRRRREDRPDPADSPEQQRQAALAGLCFLVAILGGLGLLVVYARGGQVQLEGLLLAVSLGGIGIGLGVWGKYLFGQEIVTDEREPMSSGVVERTETSDVLAEAEQEVTRRTFLTRLLIGAGGAFLVAMVFPLRSLGPNPGGTLLRTSWRRGLLVVDENGLPVKADDIDVNGILTVFPEGHTDAEDSQAVIVKVDPNELRLPPGRGDWAPSGNVCYSKVCTHAGCPVGLFVQELHQLQCPCHQSAFDVLDGAQVVFGPAPRPLPQLGLYVDSAGYLRARGDFPEPVGPGWWGRPSRGGA
jgi:ubiquinol-cytochrome c reductase iron-sulfur subunit